MRRFLLLTLAALTLASGNGFAQQSTPPQENNQASGTQSPTRASSSDPASPAVEPQGESSAGGAASTASAGAGTAIKGDVAAGATLWDNNCTSCHAINEKVVGPALRNVHTKHNEAYLLRWIKNSQEVIKSGDKYANELFKEYNESVMPTFGDFSDQDVRNIVAYIASESALPVPVAGQVDPNNVDSKGRSYTMEEAKAPFYTRFNTDAWAAIVAGLALLVLALLFITRGINRKYDEGLRSGTLDKAKERTFISRFNPKIVTLSVVGLALGAFGAYSTQQMLNTGQQQGYKPTQPIAYSHKLHAGKYQIQCSYCHTGVERWKSATIPATNICMNCHNVIKTNSPEIKKIVAARESGTPIQWVRIHNLQDFVYFNHYQHYKVGGIKCQKCHGAIQNMVEVKQAKPLTMGWCIECHRETKVNLENGYYQTVHKALAQKHGKAAGGKGLTVAQMGGLECSKCHY